MSTFKVRDLLDTDYEVEGYIFKIDENKILSILDQNGNHVAAFFGWSSIVEVSR